MWVVRETMRVDRGRRALLDRVSTRSLSGSSGPRTLRVVDWGYVYDGDPLRRFERRHDAVVQVETVPNSAAALDRLRREPTPDLVALGNYAVPRATEAGLLQPLGVEDLDAYDAVFDTLKRPYFEDDGRVYAVPRSFGQTPLCYRRDRVDTPPTGWAALVDGQVSSTCARDDAALAGLYASLVADGDATVETLSDVDDETLRERFASRLSRVDRLWRATGDARAAFRRLEPATAGPVWRFVARRMQRAGAPVSVVRPEEGTKAWFVQFARPAGSEASADGLAEAFVEAWFDWLGWETLMQPLDIPVPSAAMFERYGVERETYGFDDFDQFVEQPPLPQPVVDRYERVWTDAKRAAGLDDGD